ncbi:MAG: hemerythrin domain-containing protein [Holophagaceae bacterium]|uniref:Hemerythrin domain-containing protein n=1 Tax=Candidatus Geothrix skivensis TaxID=2954439 RepID=A0A9D7SJU4_9BACT|nr:hemerythrin domain-containing protein [Holophagaceae bacterium]MBK9797246.1 hemerythrin domain-containing protein [Candidatus Geothrix skivensis]
MTPPPQIPSADAPNSRTLNARLTADHGEIEGLFRDARMALERDLQAEAHTVVDRIWMRLAVHIRAEHKVVFPALVEVRPDLQSVLQALHEDHDYFMSALAGAVKAMKGPSPDVALIRAALEAVGLRLDSHNAIEEETIYPAADELPREQRLQVLEDVSRELAFLPIRHGR